MDIPGNQHCASCIGTLSFSISGDVCSSGTVHNFTSSSLCDVNVSVGLHAFRTRVEFSSCDVNKA